ncbi:hypothetical protein HD806DRAFT_494427 [Xylariaceae sp. AK1471]|nr:hypothetical protein HD806DRAFT_494427 [Xylariaceae sp. AK1471]
MEPFGIGANVLTFVLLGIKSAKTIHSILSAVEDGPRIVQQTADDILQLHWILEQLRQSPFTTNDDALKGQLRLCVEQLCSLARAVERLQISPSLGISGRLWKRLRTIISEKDLSVIGAQIARQVNILGLRLNVFSSNSIDQSRVGGVELLHMVDTLGKSMNEQHNAQNTRITNLEENIFSSLDTCESNTKAELSSIQQCIGATSSISTQKLDEIHTLLRELKYSMIPALSQHSSTGVKVYREAGGGSPNALPADSYSLNGRLSVCEEMRDSIDRLCELVQEKGRCIDTYADDDDQANRIYEDLQTLLKSVRKQYVSACQMKANISTTEAQAVAHQPFYDDLHRFGRSFGQGELFINQEVKKRNGFPPGKAHQIHRTFDEIYVGIGTVSLMVKKRNGSRANDLEAHSCFQKRHPIDYTMLFTFIPDHRHRQDLNMVVASTVQEEFPNSSVASISRLMVNRVLPAKSWVFQLVREGRLQELQELLKNGEASLRDHDEYGASLLFYATQQPEMCKFLIDSGLDVDHVAEDTGINGFSSSKPICSLQLELNDFDMESEELTRVNQCRRLLLEAGADPTIDLDSVSAPFLEMVALDGDSESVRVAWKSESTRSFVDVNKYSWKHRGSPLLLRCEGIGGGLERGAFSQLFDIGLSIHDRDDEDRTCLHIALENASPRPPRFVQDLEAIKYLVEEGADPYATDYNRRTVSDAAYTAFSSSDEPTSYPGDLWDSVLQSCGYEIEQFRLGYPRVSRYTKYYRRQDFEELWRGREDCCPYWNDTI